MSKFTPGKWIADCTHTLKLSDYEVLSVAQENDDMEIVNGKKCILMPFWGKRIAFIPIKHNGDISREEVNANARLIAAAPEMYELLREELIPTSDYGGIPSLSRADKIHKLLARIDGEEAEA